jgi:hypothetical protein
MGLALAFHFAWRPHRIEKVGLRKAGEWIYRAHGRPGARVISLTDPRPAFYAHGRTVALPWLVRGYWDKPREFADFFAAVRRLKPDYLLIQTDSVERGIPDFYEGARKAGLVSIQRFRRSGLEDSIGEVWVYRLSDWWGAEARRGQP